MAKVGRKSKGERDLRKICIERFNAWAGNTKFPDPYRFVSNIILSNILGLTDITINIPGTRPPRPPTAASNPEPPEVLEPPVVDETTEAAAKMAADWIKS